MPKTTKKPAPKRPTKKPYKNIIKSNKSRNSSFTAFAVIAALMILGGFLFVFLSRAAGTGNLSITSPQQVFTLTNPPVNEASGFATSQGLYFAQNDSGGETKVYAYNTSSQLVATIAVPGASNSDWEDLSIAPNASGNDDLYIADIGNNSKTRNTLKIYKFTLPTINTLLLNQQLTAGTVTTYPINYQNGPADAESFSVNPVNKRMYIVTKQSSQGTLYESPATLSTSTTNTMIARGTVPVTSATGSAISRDCQYYAVTGYSGQTQGQVYKLQNCDIPTSIANAANRVAFNPPSLSQGEGVTFTPDAKHLVFNTENGAKPPVWAIPNPLYTSTTTTTVTPTVTSTITPTPSPSPSTSSLRLQSENDTYISSDSPNTNYGSANPLKATSSTNRAFLRFNTYNALPSGKTLTGAKLRLYTVKNNLTSGGYEVRRSLVSFNSSTLTWNNQGTAFGTEILAVSSPPKANSWIEIPIPMSTITYNSSTKFGLRYTVTGSDAQFTSTEGSNKPELILEYR